MRILQVTSAYYPSMGGVERHVRGVSEGLAQLGHEVVVATMARGGCAATNSTLADVAIRRFPAFGRGVYCFPVGLWHYLKQHGPSFDIVHAYNYHALPLLFTIVGKGHSRLIISPCYHTRGHSPIADLLHRAYDPPAFAALRQRARHVICLSDGEAELVKRRMGVAPARVSVVPSGIVPPDPQSGSGGARTEPLIISVGRLDAYKRVDRLIACLPYLPEATVLAIIGTGPERPRLEHLALSLGVQQRVQFLGKVSDTELQRWYHRAAVVVSLSEAESFGITVVEALAAGCRVVCNDIPAFKDFASEFPQAVSLVSTRGPLAAIAAQVQAALTHPDPIKVNLARYTWPAVTANLVNIYANVA